MLLIGLEKHWMPAFAGMTKRDFFTLVGGWCCDLVCMVALSALDEVLVWIEPRAAGAKGAPFNLGAVDVSKRTAIPA